MGLRETKKKLQRRQILETAIELFRERGYDATRVQDIIEQVQISEGTFFNYFPTKDSLLHEFALEAIDSYASLLNHTVASAEQPVCERIRALMRVIADQISSDREFMAVVVTRSNLFFGAEGRLAERERGAYELLEQLFREGQRRGEIRKDVAPMQLAEMLTAIYLLTTTNWLTGWWKQSEPLTPRLMRAIDVLLAGCRSDSEDANPRRARPRRR